MNAKRTTATATRVMHQLAHDPRTVGLVLFVPCLLIIILRYAFDGEHPVFNMVAPMILAIFPLLMMFLLTSIVTLRERTTGTLDRLMTMPISKFDLIFGYAAAFSIVGLAQACLVSLVALGFLGVTVLGGTVPVLIVAIFSAFLGTALGLFVSAFATSEFQAVELVMPIMMPQVLMCGLFVPRDHMAHFLEWLSNAFPLTYGVDAMRRVTTTPHWPARLSIDLLAIAGFSLVALVLGSVTIRRKE